MFNIAESRKSGDGMLYREKRVIERDRKSFKVINLKIVGAHAPSSRCSNATGLDHLLDSSFL